MTDFIDIEEYQQRLVDLKQDMFCKIDKWMEWYFDLQIFRETGMLIKRNGSNVIQEIYDIH